jgi:hypothetical protein
MSFGEFSNSALCQQTSGGYTLSSTRHLLTMILAFYHPDASRFDVARAVEFLTAHPGRKAENPDERYAFQCDFEIDGYPFTVRLFQPEPFIGFEGYGMEPMGLAISLNRHMGGGYRLTNPLYSFDIDLDNSHDVEAVLGTGVAWEEAGRDREASR